MNKMNGILTATKIGRTQRKKVVRVIVCKHHKQILYSIQLVQEAVNIEV